MINFDLSSAESTKKVIADISVLVLEECISKNSIQHNLIIRFYDKRSYGQYKIICEKTEKIFDVIVKKIDFGLYLLSLLRLILALHEKSISSVGYNLNNLIAEFEVGYKRFEPYIENVRKIKSKELYNE